MKRVLVGGSILALAAGCATPSPESACTSAPEALTVCPSGSTVKGVDVSYYEGAIDWGAVKAGGWQFAFVRVSDGLDYQDPTFGANWSGTKANGIVRGAYQFFRPGEDPVAQADLLLSTMGPLAAGDLPAVMDIEVTDGQPLPTIKANMHTWLQRVEHATGIRPIVYTAAFMSSNIGAGFAGYPLWVANYEVTCPLMPSNFTSWKFWQSSSTADVAGIPGPTDVDEFNGTLAALLAFAKHDVDGGALGDAGAPTDAGAGAPADAGTPPPDGGDHGQAMGGGAVPDAGPAADPCAR